MNSELQVVLVTFKLMKQPTVQRAVDELINSQSVVPSLETISRIRGFVIFLTRTAKSIFDGVVPNSQI
jgi:hypothetical protein